MNIGTGHGASVGRTVKGIMSVFLPLLHISRSHFCVLTVWALKIEDGKESMKEEERGEEEGLAGREGYCLLCGSEKTWASPRQAPGEPLAKITCWNPWAGISWLRTASKCRHCQRTTGRRPWLWLEAARGQKELPPTPLPAATSLEPTQALL